MHINFVLTLIIIIVQAFSTARDLYHFQSLHGFTQQFGGTVCYHHGSEEITRFNFLPKFPALWYVSYHKLPNFQLQINKINIIKCSDVNN